MKKLPGLDILRIIFAVIIAFFHLSIHFNIHFKIDIITGMLDNVISVGAIFMVGFFMLSGFVLQYNYRETDFLNRYNLKNFYVKRFFSIYPAYFVFLVIVLSCRLSFPDTLPKVFALLGCEFLCLQTFFPTTFNICGNGGTWFISVIIFLYILFPFISIVIKRGIKYKKCCFMVCYFFSIYHGLMQFLFGGSLANYYANFLMRLPEFMMGMLLAELFIETKGNDKCYNLFTVSIATTLFIVAINKYLPILGKNYTQYNFIIVPYITILIIFMAKQDLRFLESWGGKWINRIASLQYSFYLTQTLANRIVAWGISKLLINEKNNIIIVVISLSLNLCFAIIMNIAVEKPAKKCIYKGLGII